MKLTHTSSNGHVLFRIQDDNGLDVGELRLTGGDMHDLADAREAVCTMEGLNFFIGGLLDALKGLTRRRHGVAYVDSITLTAYPTNPEIPRRPM